MNFLRHTKALLLRVARSLGCDLSQTSPFSENPFVDLRKLAATVPRLGFDVGANEGQTACELRRVFPEARINVSNLAKLPFAHSIKNSAATSGFVSSGSRSVITKAKRRFTKLGRA
jgi:hypothetical protein